MRYLACLRSHVLLFPYISDHSGSALPVVSIAETMLIITSAIRVSSPTSGPRFLLSFGVRSSSCVHRRNSRPAISLSIRSKPGEFGRFRQSPFSKDRPRFALQYHTYRRAAPRIPPLRHFLTHPRRDKRFTNYCNWHSSHAFTPIAVSIDLHGFLIPHQSPLGHRSISLVGLSSIPLTPPVSLLPSSSSPSFSLILHSYYRCIHRFPFQKVITSIKAP